MAKKKKVAAKPSRRAESMTGAKEGAVEFRTGFAQGDLKLPEPNDYQHHKKALLGALDKQRTATSLVRTARKNALAAGVDPDSILEANRIVRANDPKGTANKMAQLAFALEQEGFSIHITITDSLAGDHMDTVYRRFYKDALDGKALDNPYPEKSDLAARAAQAWRHGSAVNMKLTAAQSDEALSDEEREPYANLPPAPDVSGLSPTVH